MRRKRHLLSYLAGVFDGEGCVHIGKNNLGKRRLNELYSPNYNLKVEVHMTEEIIPRLFQSTFGGNVRATKPSKPNYKTSYCWNCASRQAADFLKDILPYALIKRPQIEVALHFAANIRPHGGHMTHLTNEELALREADYILCKALKKGDGNG